MHDIFKVTPADNTNVWDHSDCYVHSTKGLWTTDNYYYFYNTVTQYADSYVVLEWELHHPTYGEVSKFAHDKSYYRDYYKITYASNDVRLYLVKKITSTFSQGSAHIFGKFRSKHHIDTSSKIYSLRTDFSEITCIMDYSHYWTHRMVDEYGVPAVIMQDV